MDQEISKGTWVGATILAIVAILGLSFAVYGIARSLVNNSSADFVSTVDSVGTSSFNDFDGTTVSGLQVRSALDTYEGDKIAILVNTAGMEEALKKAPDDKKNSTAAFVRQEPVDTHADNMIEFKDKHYMNYNAILDDLGADGKKLSNTSAGYLQYTGLFRYRKDDKGNPTSDLQFNTLKTNYKTTGCSEFIATGSNFNAKLIKDASGTVVGVMFTQVY